MDKKLDRRVSRTRNNIRTALLDLLAEKQGSQISIKELAERADINRKTFYSHYDSIDDVFDQMGDEIIEKLEELQSKHKLTDSTFDIQSLFKSLNESISEDLDLFEKLVKSNSYNYLWLKVKAILKESIIKEFSAQKDVNLDVYKLHIEFIASGLMSMYAEWINSDKKISLDELGEAAALIAFNGFSSIVKPL